MFRMDKWPVNEPFSLENICIDFFLDNIFKYLDKTDESYCFKPGITFPQGLSDKLLLRLAQQTKHLQGTENNVFGIFNNRASTVLTELPLRYTAVKPHELEFLCLHPVREIDITYCPEILSTFIKAINQTARTLRSLRLGGVDQIERLEVLLSEELIDEDIWPNATGDAASNRKPSAIFNLPNLRCLFLRDVKTFRPMDGVYNLDNISLLDRVLCSLKTLTHLDLCECQLEKKTLEGLGNLDFPCLVSLSLSDVLNGCEFALDNLCKFTKLKHLDVSQGDDTTVFLPVQYPKPTERLQSLITSMPDLVSLDISGTNLAGFALIQPVSHKLAPRALETDQEEDGLPGCEGRRFQFLGLFNCSDDASHRKNLPSDKVTGDASEEQLLLSIHVYRDKPNLLKRALNSLFNKFRYETVRAQCASLEGILGGMNRNKHDRHLQISGSASLFYIVKGINKEKISHKQKRKVINCLLDAMERHMTEHTMMRNGCLTLCHFNIPYEVLYCYNRLVGILLQMLRQEFSDDFLQRIGIFLLNSLACQVDGEQKKTLGDMGTVEVMCKIIRQKLEAKICDEILEVCWSTLWNVTDETETNCERFMDEGGMYMFLDCFKMFPTKEELLRNMMGLMGNIAEVQELRRKLMNEDYVTVFTNFLESTKDGIEVSYNAAGVLSHLLSDDERMWSINTPPRDEVINRIISAIKRWPLESKRNINYRSFGPILKLVRSYKCPASQYWAIWALCNLTQVYPEKYCLLLKSEGGLELLQEVAQNPGPIEAIRELAAEVLAFVTAKLANRRFSTSAVEAGEIAAVNGEQQL